MKAIGFRDGGPLENTIGTGTLAALAVCAFVGCAPNVEALGSVHGQSVNIDSQAVSRPIDGSHPSPPGAPSMFVVDSTNTLYSFDVDGNPGVLHGIAYDPHNDRFYVATDRLGLLAFDRAGTYIPRTPQSTLPVLAVVYDSTHSSLWGIIDRHAVVQFSEDGNTPLPGLPATAVRYRHDRGPLAVAYCAAGGDTPGKQNAIAVAFGEAKAGSRGVGAGQTYDTGGKPIGSSYGAKIVNPHGMSCSSRGEVFVAADNGLLEITLDGAVIGSLRYSQSLTAPIYGVFAAY